MFSKSIDARIQHVLELGRRRKARRTHFGPAGPKRGALGGSTASQITSNFEQCILT